MANARICDRCGDVTTDEYYEIFYRKCIIKNNDTITKSPTDSAEVCRECFNYFLSVAIKPMHNRK